MPQVTIRNQQLRDAERFYEILSNPNFIYFSVKPKSLEAEKEWLKSTRAKRKSNSEWNYTILYDNIVVGGIGIKINQARPYIGEIGYFLDEQYWNKSITTKATKLVEKEGFKKLKLTRIEILMQPKNKASERVAIKCGYKKEGLLKKAIKYRDGKMKDVFLYAKVV